MTDLAFHAEFLITLAVFLASGGIVAYLSWADRRPRKSLEPRLFSGTPIVLIFGFIALLALVHLVNLGGFTTGNRPRI
jgi:hypothetical protein